MFEPHVKVVKSTLRRIRTDVPDLGLYHSVAENQ